jgi:hypothetical protein
METLNHTIGRRMECGGVLYLNTAEFELSSKKAGFELSTLVCCYALGQPKRAIHVERKAFTTVSAAISVISMDSGQRVN